MKQDIETVLFGAFIIIVIVLAFLQADINEKRYNLHHDVEIENFKNQQY